ncbi:TonB family protein [Sphingomonas baiyangensis]|nr:TonB family protein [Sphingomonas baiyangensis]
MSNESANAIRRTTLAAIGAVAASITMLGAAAGPVNAAGPVGTANWSRNASRVLGAELRTLDAVPYAVRRNAAAIVTARFDTNGRVADVMLVRGTGDARLDAEAMRAAQAARLPRLPIALRGRSVAVPLEIFFADPDLNPGRATVRAQTRAVMAARHHDVPAGPPQG